MSQEKNLIWWALQTGPVFTSKNGNLTVPSLFKLNKSGMEDVYSRLQKQMLETPKTGISGEKTFQRKVVEKKMDLFRFVFKKKEEIRAAATARAQKKQRVEDLLNLLAKAEEAELLDGGIKKIRKELKALQEELKE